MTSSVRDRILDELDADQVHGIAITRETDGAIHAVVSQSTTWSEIEDGAPTMPVLDVRTVTVDLDEDRVRIGDNGLWVPRGDGIEPELTRLLARSTNDVQGGTDADSPPVELSAVDDLDAADVLDEELEDEEDDRDGQHVDKMESHGGIDPSRGWGYGAGPPPEIADVVDKLEDASLDPEDHVTRLVWGKKEPMDRRPRPVSELTGNYGVELHPDDSGLIALDVDYPEDWPVDVDLPDTWEVSSPHGDERRRHIILRCEEKEEIAEEIGGWAVQGVDWGDLWIGDRYVVGPGSQLSEFGCDYAAHERGERGGCSSCEDPGAGIYRTVNDDPIAEVDAETILGLLERSDGYAIRDRGPDAPDDDLEDEEPDVGGPRCDNCGAAVADESELMDLASGSICRGGCE
jgi:hypothetical protein